MNEYMLTDDQGNEYSYEAWSVHLAFDSVDEAAAYVRKVQKPVAVDV